MKKFEMPVVVLNEMTMNESIASDCCFKSVTEGYVTTKTVLNGGSIGTYTTYQLKPAVEAYFGTRASMPSYHYTLKVPKDASALTVGPDVGVGSTVSNVLGSVSYTNWDLLSFSKDADGIITGFDVLGASTTNPAPALTTAGMYIVQNGGACDHFGDCAFTTKVEVKNAHIGATMKHLFGGAQWGQPHIAQQYNS